MRNALALSAVALLAACGVSEDKFWSKYEATYCEEYDACHTGDLACSLLNAGEFRPSADDDCDYDPKMARDCLRGEYVCDDVFGAGYEILLSPEACEKVYLCDVAVEDTDDTEDTDTGSR